MFFIGAIIRRMVLDNIKAGLNTSRQILKYVTGIFRVLQVYLLAGSPPWVRRAAWQSWDLWSWGIWPILKSTRSIQARSAPSLSSPPSGWSLYLRFAPPLFHTASLNPTPYLIFDYLAISCSILHGLVADTCQWCWTLQESLYVCSLATVYPNLSVRTDFGYLWITKVGSVQNTAAVQTFAQSRNLLRRLAEYKPGPHVFPHWSPSRYMKVSLPRTSHERSLYLRQFRHGFLVMSLSDCWLNCLEYWW